VLRAVLDTNVVVSGVLNVGGRPRRILNGAKRGLFTLVTSEPLIQELNQVVNRADIAIAYHLPLAYRSQIAAFLAAWSIGNPPPLDRTAVAADPFDDRVLECALAGKADYIVSGDRHLLALKEFRGIRIVTPREFLGVLQRAR